jgi:anti-sigma regulatory factor (Ser/Thr protein kinase)
MYELALFVLDLAQNSLTAGATCVKIWLAEDAPANRLTVTVADNGCGMTPATLQCALDPFMTTKAARRKKIGLGLPFFRQLVEDCQGAFRIRSRPGGGTVISGTYPLDNLDQPPLGVLADTLLALVSANPAVRFRFVRRRGGQCSVFDTRPVRAALGADADALWQTAEMMAWFRKELAPLQ